MGEVKPQPARAKITEGTYDFAMSVKDLGDGTNEVRWYFQKKYTGEQTSYWFGGTVIDTGKVTDKINGFYFAKNHGNGAEATTLTGFNLMEVQVDYGASINVTPNRGRPIISVIGELLRDAGAAGECRLEISSVTFLCPARLPAPTGLCCSWRIPGTGRIYH
jgi:hypothetical protein